MRNRTNINKAFIIAVLCLAISGSGAARADGKAADTGKVTVKPRAGVFVPRGDRLDGVALTAGAQIDWAIDDTFGLRLGYEYAKIKVDDGSSLKLSRFPFMFVTPLRKSSMFRNFYTGFGIVYTNASYSDGHYPKVNKPGPAAFIGVKLSKYFSAELMFDHMKRYGREYGGYSFCLTYDGL
jgi:hypothetical protein